MSKLPESRHYRRSDQWLAIIEQWQSSGLSAPVFCAEHGIGYSSFCQWRQRLLGKGSPAPVHPSAAFVDVSRLACASSSGWQIVLRLGEGIELQLSRG